MSRLEAFARFWWDFIVGDDWPTAVAVVLGIAVTAVFAQAGLASWWILPLVVVLVLTRAVWSEARRQRAREQAE
jgi:hypothetical protein